MGKATHPRNTVIPTWGKAKHPRNTVIPTWGKAKHPRNTVIPTEAARRFFFFFAPAKKSGRAVEGSLFDRSRGR